MKKQFSALAAVFLAAALPGPLMGESDLFLGGEISAELAVFPHDFGDAGAVDLGNVFRGKVELTASADDAQGTVKLRLGVPEREGASPVTLDEAYLRGFFASLTVEGGLRKLSWGKADTLGVLDVVNPLDYTDWTTLGNSAEQKIPRPLLHLSWNPQGSSRLEGVFVPRFAPHKLPSNAIALPPGFTLEAPDTENLHYAQSGLRFTTTLAAVDLGAEYFYGNLFRPRSALSPGAVSLSYDRYHLFGADYAQVLFGFNLRGELAFLRIDREDGGGQSSWGWNVGFDRDLFWGIKVNLQGSRNPDPEENSVKLAAELSRSFFQNDLTLRLRGLWDYEDRDYLILPSLKWEQGDLGLELSGGIFGGPREGSLGQFWEKSFVKTVMRYQF